MRISILVTIALCFALTNCAKLGLSSSYRYQVKQAYNGALQQNARLCLLQTKQVRFLSDDGSALSAFKSCASENQIWKVTKHTINTSRYAFQNQGSGKYLDIDSSGVYTRNNQNNLGTQFRIYQCSVDVKAICIRSGNNFFLKIDDNQNVLPSVIPSVNEVLIFTLMN